MRPRLVTALKLYAFAVLGVFLVAAPWTFVWDRSIVLIVPEGVGVWLEAGWVRGVVSALGALDLAAAAAEGTRLWGAYGAEGPGGERG